ncbi:MAG: molybdate ABC transporter substrate-binding protein [Desulfovibrio sp.]|nr:molybdate ABC transporter substrate-binding protein [Desulfovibrio sp.]
MIKKLILGCLISALCATGAAAAELTVSAAASLKNAFDEIAGAFEKENPGIKINANYAASNPLLRQIVEGAPVDVFASADQATMNQAAEAKVLRPDTRVDFARNDLVLIVPKGSKAIKGLEELKGLERIAIGNPDSVPAGRYAKQALENAGLWNELNSKYVQGTNVRQVLDYIARGEADAGFVYRTDALQQKDKVDIVMVVGGIEPVAYPIAVTETGNNPDAALKFIDFVASPKGQDILAKYGFAKP